MLLQAEHLLAKILVMFLLNVCILLAEILLFLEFRLFRSFFDFSGWSGQAAAFAIEAGWMMIRTMLLALGKLIF